MEHVFTSCGFKEGDSVSRSAFEAMLVQVRDADDCAKKAGELELTNVSQQCLLVEKIEQVVGSCGLRDLIPSSKVAEMTAALDSSPMFDILAVVERVTNAWQDVWSKLSFLIRGMRKLPWHNGSQGSFQSS